MAIPLPREKVIDNENNKFIGIELPFQKSDGPEGYFKSTQTTFDAIKQNIILLLNTRSGERVFQPSIGVPFDKFLFEDVTDELIMIMDDEISQVFDVWMPFITITKLEISANNSLEISNKLSIYIEFFMNQNPNILESIQLNIG